MPNRTQKLEEIEIKLLLDGICERYGFDFHDYAPASLKRRILKCCQDEQLQSIAGLLERVLHEQECMERFLQTVSVDVTSMFRDPRFFLAFRQKVVPILQAAPFIRIWHAGCASGEEVYSMAILMQEAGLYEKTRMYATDMNELLLDKGKSGIYPLSNMREYTDNYLESGGKAGLFAEYYTSRYEHILFKPSLQKNIFWAQHNLVTDGSFNEFQVIICRNVLIYFNKALQGRVQHLFNDSLCLNGIVGLGSKESMHFSACENNYVALDEQQKIYQKVR